MSSTDVTRAGSDALGRIPPGIKITAQASAEPSEEDLAFIAQMGVKHVVLWTDGARSSAEYYSSRKALFADHGLDVFGFGNWDVHNQDAIVLGLANRDDKVEEYKRHLRSLGKAGIPYTTYAHMPNGIWSTEPEEARGGARARAFALANAREGHWFKNVYSLPLTNGREYSEAEVWENYTRFIREAARSPSRKGC